MFGIFYLIANTIGTVISGSKAAKENYDARQRGYEKQAQGKNRAGIYTDRLGGTRRLSDNKRVMMDNLYCAEAKGEDCYMRDQYGHPIRNMSEEIRRERFNDAKAKNDPGISVVEWKQNIPKHIAREKNIYCFGTQYKDLKNGRVYVCRRFSIPRELTNGEWFNSVFYMDISTGLLVRETDSSKEKRRRGDKHYPPEEISEKFIEYFNNKQSTEGYYHNSKYPDPKNLDMDGKENKFDKKIRLDWYFCNDDESIDRI